MKADVTEDITIIKVLLIIILGLFSILLIGTHARLNELENNINYLKGYSINNTIQGE